MHRVAQHTRICFDDLLLREINTLPNWHRLAIEFFVEQEFLQTTVFMTILIYLQYYGEN